MDQHDEIVVAVADALRADHGVMALVGGRVFHPGQEPQGLPRVVVSRGRAHGVQRSAAPVLVQRDVRVECFANEPSVLHLLLIAVQAALNGKLGGSVYDRAVLTHTGDETDADGTLSRRDVYGVFVRLRPDR